MEFYNLQSEAVTISTTSLLLSENNGARIHFSIENRGASSIFIHFGEEDATISNGIEVRSGELYEPFRPGRSKIYAISQSGSNACVVTEG